MQREQDAAVARQVSRGGRDYDVRTIKFIASSQNQEHTRSGWEGASREAHTKKVLLLLLQGRTANDVG
jgi:hypothetical protein